MVRAAADRCVEALRATRAGDAGAQARLTALERTAGQLAADLLAHAADASPARAGSVQAALAQSVTRYRPKRPSANWRPATWRSCFSTSTPAMPTTTPT